MKTVLFVSVVRDYVIAVVLVVAVVVVIITLSLLLIYKQELIARPL
jgi:hypothetical protein